MDERVILSNKLQSLGISKEKSVLIALDAGSSQIVVNRKYLLDINIPMKLLEPTLKEIIQFYMGELGN